MVTNIPIEYESFVNRSIWPTDDILTVDTIAGKSWPRSKGNERALNDTQISWTGASTADIVYCLTQDTLFRRWSYLYSG